eukprot:TRINITY_DN9429_c0_g1_i4.p1 TRINITY_DN9429_c0_g1~~TRINITY_DN9429_c0_g1_i4.p1  ORF type:complete len:329 (+),score=39.74 TRINITY_DN9429_c0_g1_i4:133-1119(+)
MCIRDRYQRRVRGKGCVQDAQVGLKLRAMLTSVLIAILSSILVCRGDGSRDRNLALYVLTQTGHLVNPCDFCTPAPPAGTIGGTGDGNSRLHGYLGCQLFLPLGGTAPFTTERHWRCTIASSESFLGTLGAATLVAQSPYREWYNTRPDMANYTGWYPYLGWNNSGSTFKSNPWALARPRSTRLKILIEAVWRCHTNCASDPEWALTEPRITAATWEFSSEPANGTTFSLSATLTADNDPCPSWLSLHCDRAEFHRFFLIVGIATSTCCLLCCLWFFLCGRRRQTLQNADPSTELKAFPETVLVTSLPEPHLGPRTSLYKQVDHEEVE